MGCISRAFMHPLHWTLSWNSQDLTVINLFVGILQKLKRGWSHCTDSNSMKEIISESGCFAFGGGAPEQSLVIEPTILIYMYVKKWCALVSKWPTLPQRTYPSFCGIKQLNVICYLFLDGMLHSSSQISSTVLLGCIDNVSVPIILLGGERHCESF